MRMTKSLPIALSCVLVSSTLGAELDELLAKAEEGDVVAQAQVAEAYAKGTDVEKDTEEAAKWYEKAAEQGDAGAQWTLGTLYLGGRGLRRDSLSAAKWFHLAAEQGRADAQLQIARMHLSGAGVPEDDIEAYKWAKLSEKQKNAAAIRVIRFLEDRMTPEDIAFATTLIEEYEENRKIMTEEVGVPPVAPMLDDE